MKKTSLIVCYGGAAFEYKYQWAIFTRSVEAMGKIEEWAQEKILTNVWCNNCCTSVSILLKSTEMIQEDLILRGKCKKCGHDLCRVVGPENN